MDPNVDFGAIARAASGASGAASTEPSRAFVNTRLESCSSRKSATGATTAPTIQPSHGNCMTGVPPGTAGSARMMPQSMATTATASSSSTTAMNIYHMASFLGSER